MKIVARMRTVTWHSSSWSSDHSPRSIGPIVESILRAAPQMLDSNRVIFGECYCIYLLFHSCIYGLLRPSNHTPAPQISTVACNFLNTYADILQRVSLHLQTSHFVFSTRLLTIVTHPWNYDTQPPATTTLCCSQCNSIRVIQFLLWCTLIFTKIRKGIFA